MEERTAALTVRAAARKLIDFSEADFNDKNWWRRRNLIFTALEDEHHLQFLQGNLQHCAGLLGARLEDKSFKQIQEASRDALQQTASLLFPWSIKTPEKVEGEDAEALTQLWTETFGDPNDPARLDLADQVLAGYWPAA